MIKVASQITGVTKRFLTHTLKQNDTTQVPEENTQIPVTALQQGETVTQNSGAIRESWYF